MRCQAFGSETRSRMYVQTGNVRNVRRWQKNPIILNLFWRFNLWGFSSCHANEHSLSRIRSKVETSFSPPSNSIIYIAMSYFSTCGHSPSHRVSTNIAPMILCHPVPPSPEVRFMFKLARSIWPEERIRSCPKSTIRKHRKLFFV